MANTYAVKIKERRAQELLKKKRTILCGVCEGHRLHKCDKRADMAEPEAEDDVTKKRAEDGVTEICERVAEEAQQVAQAVMRALP